MARITASTLANQLDGLSSNQQLEALAHVLLYLSKSQDIPQAGMLGLVAEVSNQILDGGKPDLFDED